VQNLDDVRCILSRKRRRNLAADENPQRLVDVERPECHLLLAVQPLLLEEGQQTGDQVQL
jgi:hypothetical protein